MLSIMSKSRSSQVIGAMRTIPKRLKTYIKALAMPEIIEGAQTSVLIVIEE